MSRKRFEKTLDYLRGKKRVLFLTTSNRWSGDNETPKSSIVAERLAEKLGKEVNIIDVANLKIYDCEGNVSTRRGNTCGEKEALLKDSRKNPSRCHRCWASINHKDDELWKVSKAILESDAVVFFGSVRWGVMNGVYQRLLERLTWLENRKSTLGEENILGDIDVGLIVIGQNWNGENVVKHQKKVLKFFGFNTPKELFWNWQYTQDSSDESQEGYKKSFDRFMNIFGFS